MKIVLALSLVIFTIFACSSDLSREVKKYTIEQFIDNTQIRQADDAAHDQSTVAGRFIPG